MNNGETPPGGAYNCAVRQLSVALYGRRLVFGALALFDLKGDEHLLSLVVPLNCRGQFCFVQAVRLKELLNALGGMGHIFIVERVAQGKLSRTDDLSAIRICDYFAFN